MIRSACILFRAGIGERTLNKLKIGIIGAGGIATSIHLPVLSTLPEAEVLAVCDLAVERAAAASKAFGIRMSLPPILT